jgi:hypothetical protein
MNDNPFRRLREGIFRTNASVALDRLVSASSAPLEYLSWRQKSWPPPGVELTPESAAAEVRVWAASTFGTLELLYVDLDPAVADQLRQLVRAETLGDQYASFRDVRQWLVDAQLQAGPTSAPGPTFCPLCGHDFSPEPAPDSPGVFQGHGCAEFRTAGVAWCELLTPEHSRNLAWFVHTRNKRGEPAPVVCPGSLSPGGGVLTLGDVVSTVPRTIGAIHDELLVTIATVARSEPVQPDQFAPTERSRFGRYVPLREEEAPLGLSTGFADLRFHVGELVKGGYLEIKDQAIPNYVEARLTLDGWRRVEALEKGAVDKPNQCFVAMWFSAQLEPVYKTAIEPAIRAAGYDAMQMAFLEHNDDINDRIIAEIRKSRLVVADFTGNRGGVYFEAGFALGLGKPVIWTCKRSFFEEHGVHFDTQARNHILWDEPADLKRALQARIEATVPRTP